MTRNWSTARSIRKVAPATLVGADLADDLRPSGDGDDT
jgi:hypothetical protein